MNKTATPPYPCPDIDGHYDADEQSDDSNGDARGEVRGGECETGLKCEYSRHYEAKAVAAKLPDGSWVGWTFWYGGGKHGEPSGIDWIDDAYDLKCEVVQKPVKVFSRA